ncbi:hypothetical protein PLESTM_000042900 [Pleodorina starrii]|nr:hypothetical protein PLESTM_000042900 [Pleodorina starrii]
MAKRTNVDRRRGLLLLPGATTLLPLLVVVLLYAGRGAQAQRPYPLTGADGPLPTNQTGQTIPRSDISTTVLLERVYGMLEHENAYEASESERLELRGANWRRAVWWLVLNWTDCGAGPAAESATAAAAAPGGSCNRFCDSGGLPSMGCCDGMWLPHIELLNILEYLDDQLPRYRINANVSSCIVTWSTRLVGRWYAPLDFRAYPFEHQHLLFEFALADSQSAVAGLRWDMVAQLNHTAHTKGADLSGWRINWSKGKIYDSRTCQKVFGVEAPRYAISPSSQAASGGNATNLTAQYDSLALSDRYFSDNTAKGNTWPDDCGPFKRFQEASALFGPVVLVADIMIKRVASYYVLTNLIPVLLITLVAFVVYFMPQSALGDRMSVVLTMFLSLTAMQFVFDFPPANYINALQLVVLVSYIMIALTCVESLIVNRIATVADALKIKRNCVRKYSTLLGRAAFERYLTKELFPTHHRAHAAAAGGGAIKTKAGGAAGRVHFKSAPTARRQPAAAGNGVPGRGRRASVSSIAEVPEADPPTAAAGGCLPGMAAARVCRREDSAIEGQHLLHTSPVQPTPTPTPTEASLSSTAAIPAAATATATTAAAPPSRALRTATAPVGGAMSKRRPVRCSSAAGSVYDDADSNPDQEPAPLPPSHHVLSPFASGRTHISFAVDHDDIPPPPPASVTADARSVGSSHASAIAAVRHGCAAMVRRCRALGLGRSLRAVAAAFWAWLVGVATAPGQLYQQCKEDPAFAQFVAARIDKWACIVSVSLYVVCISVLLAIEVKVGDHKLMLGDRPGNM